MVYFHIHIQGTWGFCRLERRIAGPHQSEVASRRQLRTCHELIRQDVLSTKHVRLCSSHFGPICVVLLRLTLIMLGVSHKAESTSPPWSSGLAGQAPQPWGRNGRAQPHRAQLLFQSCIFVCTHFTGGYQKCFLPKFCCVVFSSGT